MTDKPMPPVYDRRAWKTYRRDAKCGCTAPDPADCAATCDPRPTRQCPCHYLSVVPTAADVPPATPCTCTPDRCPPDCPCHQPAPAPEDGPAEAPGWYDAGCARDCSEQHTYQWGRCALGVEPEPRVSFHRVRDMPDGERGIVTESLTLTELRDRVEAAMRTVKVQIGPNSRAALERGESVGLSGGEYWHMALAVAADLTEHANAGDLELGAGKFKQTAAHLNTAGQGGCDTGNDTVAQDGPHHTPGAPGPDDPDWNSPEDAEYDRPHRCGNCSGIDPDTCLMNPGRSQTGNGPVVDEAAPASPDREQLRQQYADAIRVKVDGTRGCANEYRLADAVLAVRDAELEDMYQRLATQAVAAHDLITRLGDLAEEHDVHKAASERMADTRAADQRAEIAETELRTLRAGLRANGADPTQIQNLWAQISLRNRQWREAKQRAEKAEAELETAREAYAIRNAEWAKATTRADRAEAALARVRALHQPDPQSRAGWKSDEDPRAYGRIARACAQCGAVDLAVRWPCDTIRALDGPQQPADPPHTTNKETR